MLAVGAAVYFIGCHLARAGVAEAPPQQAPAWNWQTWLLLGTSILTAASVVLHVVAPRTKATWDDKLRDDVDWLLSVAKDVKPPGSGAASMLVVLLLGALAAPALTACTAAQRAELKQDAKTAVINCTAQDLGSAPHLDLATLVAVVNLAALERAKCSTTGSLDWQCVKRDLISQGAVLGGCTLVAMVTAAASAFTSPGDRLSATTPVLPGRVELEQFRAAVAPGVTYHTGAGDF